MVAYTGVGFWRCRPTLVRQCETPQAVGRQPIQIPALFAYTNLTPTRGVQRHEHFMENVFFKPWIGKDYDSGGIFNKKILVLGEAHLRDAGCKDCGNIENAEECADFTSKNCIEALLNGETASWTGTMHKFERSLVNHETGLEESRRIWNSLAFYNYVQKALDSSRKAPEWVDFQNSEKAFFEVIDELRPDLILVWGVTRMYDNLPGGERLRKGNELEIDGYKVKNGYYRLSDGKETRVLWVYHPSAGYSWDWWHKVIKTEL